MSQVHAAIGIPSQSRCISLVEPMDDAVQGAGGRSRFVHGVRHGRTQDPDEDAVVAKCDAHAGLGERVALGVGDALDEAVQAQATKVVHHAPLAVFVHGHAEQGGQRFA